MTQKPLFVFLLATLVALEFILAISVFGLNIGLWHSYYTIYFYMPIAIFRVMFGMYAISSYTPLWFSEPPGILRFLSYHSYGALATWFKTAGWAFILFMLLNIRPIWIVSEVYGWGSSPWITG